MFLLRFIPKAYHYITNKVVSSFFINYNKCIFYLYGFNYGRNMKIYNNLILNVATSAKVIIGDNLKFTSGSGINSLARNIKGCIHLSPNSSLKIGNNVGISSASIWCSSSITIKDNVKIGGDTIIMDTNAHSLNYLDRRVEIKDFYNAKSSPIVIEEDVFIGTRCIILRGVTIGARSIIRCGSIIDKDIPSDCIAGGNPCKIIKQININ